jgi:hypothetical protein
MTDADLQRFPIGRFQRQTAYTAEERASHIARIAAAPEALAAPMDGPLGSSCIIWPIATSTPTSA